MCLYPTASEMLENPDSFTLLLRPLTMLETTDGPLNTSAEYNCKRDAPEITASHAELLESIPPTPTMGNFPLVSSNVWLITSSALECNGLPDSPPSLENAFRAFVPRGIGRLMAVSYTHLTLPTNREV